MRSLFYFVIGGVVALCVAGCGSDGKAKDREEANGLYEAIKSLTITYIAEMSAAPDSATWARLCSEYEDSLVKVNYSFPPDTDYLMSEDQNDTITILMENYVKTRQEKIQSILYPLSPTDSIAADSIARDSISAMRSIPGVIKNNKE